MYQTLTLKWFSGSAVYFEIGQHHNTLKKEKLKLILFILTTTTYYVAISYLSFCP